MPSKKKVAQRARGMAQLCAKSEMSGSGASLLSHNLADKEHVPLQQKVSAQASGPAWQQTFAEALVDGPNSLSTNSSERSVSTDEGSSMSGRSGSPVGSECPANFPAHIEQIPSNPAAQERACRVAADLVAVRVSAPRSPVWVDNGLKGDAAAWLLVLPTRDGSSPEGRAHMPKSPKDALLLGPYVTTKNTFLEETRVGSDISFGQRSRAQSLGARR